MIEHDTMMAVIDAIAASDIAAIEDIEIFTVPQVGASERHIELFSVALQKTDTFTTVDSMVTIVFRIFGRATGGKNDILMIIGALRELFHRKPSVITITGNDIIDIQIENTNVETMSIGGGIFSRGSVSMDIMTAEQTA